MIKPGHSKISRCGALTGRAWRIKTLFNTLEPYCRTMCVLCGKGSCERVFKREAHLLLFIRSPSAAPLTPFALALQLVFYDYESFRLFYPLEKQVPGQGGQRAFTNLSPLCNKKSAKNFRFRGQGATPLPSFQHTKVLTKVIKVPIKSYLLFRWTAD